MNFPETLRYSKSHEWVKNEEGLVVIGLTDFAQSELGDLVFVNLPDVYKRQGLRAASVGAKRVPPGLSTPRIACALAAFAAFV